MQSISELKDLHEQAYTKFQSYYNKGLENARFKKGQHWSASEITEHKNDGRLAYSIPLLATKFNRILSEQRNNRFIWKPKARHYEDELKAEVGGLILRYIDDINNFKYTESEIFEDGMGKQYGVVGATIDTLKNPLGDIKLEKVPFNEVCWDINAKKYDLSDADWFQRFGWFTKEYLKTLYPESKDTIDSLSQDFDTNREQWYRINKDKDEIKVIWHYQKATKTIYYVDNGKDLVRFLTEKEAKKYAKSLNLPEQQITSNKNYYIDVTCFSNTNQIKQWDLNLFSPPFRVYFAFFDDGEFWSLIDLAKDPQRYYDRTVSSIDRATTRNIKPNNYELVKDKLHPDEIKDRTTLEKRLSKGGTMVDVLEKGTIAPIGANVNIQTDVILLNNLQGLIEDLLGGRTFQGLESKNDMTATESTLLVQAGRIANLMYLDNLKRWKKSVGELCWELMGQVYNTQRTIRILGDSYLSEEIKQRLIQEGVFLQSSWYSDQAYLRLPQDVNFGEIQVDIIIDEISGSMNARQEILQQLLTFNQVLIQNGNPPLPMDIIIPYLQIDSTIKQKLLQYYQNLMQQQQLKSQMEQALNQSKIEVGNAKIQANQMKNLENLSKTVNEFTNEPNESTTQSGI